MIKSDSSEEECHEYLHPMRFNAKRIDVKHSAILLFMVLMCVVPVSVYAEESPTFVFLDEPIAPYTFGKEGAICESGVTKSIFDELFGRLGIRYEIRLVPWARAMDSAKHGDCDGIPMLIKTLQREAFLMFSTPVVTHSEMIYFLPKRLGNFRWNDYSDLKEYNIGLINGYIYGESFMEAVDELKIKTTVVKDSRTNFQMLLAGRVDLIVEDETLATSFCDAYPQWAGQLQMAEKPISSYDWHIGICRTSPLVRRMDDINRTLDTMRSDGTLGHILNKR